MRRNFADLLKEASIDLREEYEKLWHILYDRRFLVPADAPGTVKNYLSLHDVFGLYFAAFRFRGTCLSLQEFDQKLGFCFPRRLAQVTREDVCKLAEYLWNLTRAYQAAGARQVLQDKNYEEYSLGFVLEYIHCLMDRLEYQPAEQDGVTVFAERSPAAQAVAESDQVPPELAYRLLAYHHHSMRGDLEGKRWTLVQLGLLLDARRPVLRTIAPALQTELQFVFENLELYRSNTHPGTTDYRPALAAMAPGELETWYDEVYQMCLTAFLLLEHQARRPALDALRTRLLAPPEQPDPAAPVPAAHPMTESEKV